MVPRARLELARRCSHRRILNPIYIIPPPGHYKLRGVGFLNHHDLDYIKNCQYLHMPKLC